jgi:hypothetical protein
MRTLSVLIFLILTLLHSSLAQAYIGPGVTTGMLGVIIGIASALFLAVAGVIYYPIKRMLKRRRGASPTPNSEPREKQTER